MGNNKREIQEINAGSMADIAFLLLIFFLVATTMNVDTGLARMLPPLPEDDQQQQQIDVKERNILLVFVSGSGNIMAGGEPIDIKYLKDKAKDFSLNVGELDNLPEKEEKEFELPDGSKWIYPVSSGIVSLQTARETDYRVYIEVQNELTRAFNEIRDEVAMRKFGSKFEDLDSDTRDVMIKAVPVKISEAEPREIKK
ncbi:MAG: biopolymer transporter ExbD [Rikenellaceae bacterium]